MNEGGRRRPLIFSDVNDRDRRRWRCILKKSETPIAGRNSAKSLSAACSDRGHRAGSGPSILLFMSNGDNNQHRGDGWVLREKVFYNLNEYAQARRFLRVAWSAMLAIAILIARFERMIVYKIVYG